MTAELDSILNLDVPVIVRLGECTMTCDDVVRWIPGSLIELDKSFEEDLDLLINNVPVAEGNAVKVGENFGIRISFVGDLQAKIEALSDFRPQIKTEKVESELTENDAADLAEQMLSGQL